MLKNELKKVLKNKFFLFFLIVFLLVDLSNIYKSGYAELNIEQEYVDIDNGIYEKISGVITNEKINYIINEKDLVEQGGLNAHYSHVMKYYKDFVYTYGYKQKAIEITDKARLNVDTYNNIENTGLANFNKNIVEAFNGRSITEFYRTDGIDKYFSYDFSTLMIFILILICTTSLFFKDKSSGMDNIIYTCRNGNRKILFNKLAALSLVTFGLVFSFRIIELFMYMKIYNFEGLHMPLYSVVEYRETFFNGRIIDFLIIDIIFKFVGLLIFTFIISWLSYYKKKQNTVFIFSILIYVVVIFIHFKLDIIYTPIKMLNLYFGIKNYNYVRIGNCFLSENIFIFVTSIMIIVAILISFYVKRIVKQARR